MLPCSLPGGGAGGPRSCVAPRRWIPSCKPTSPCGGAGAGGPLAWVVALLRGSAAHLLPGRGDHILLVVVICPHCVQHTVERLSAEQAGNSYGSPLPDADEAEAVATGAYVGCIVRLAQADGARAACCCLPPSCPLSLAGAGHGGRAALLLSLLGARCHVLPRDRCKVPELFWRWECRSKESPRGQWERGGKGLPEGLLVGWKVASQP